MWRYTPINCPWPTNWNEFFNQRMSWASAQESQDITPQIQLELHWKLETAGILSTVKKLERTSIVSRARDCHRGCINNSSRRLPLSQLQPNHDKTDFASIRDLDITSIRKTLLNLQVEHGTRLSILEAVRVAKAKSSKGARYAILSYFHVVVFSFATDAQFLNELN